MDGRTFVSNRNQLSPMDTVPRCLTPGEPSPLARWSYLGLVADGRSLSNLVGTLAVWQLCAVCMADQLGPPILGVEAATLRTFDRLALAVGRWMRIPRNQWSWRRKGLRCRHQPFPRFFVHDTPGGLPSHFYGACLEYHIVYLGDSTWSTRNRRIHRAQDVFPVCDLHLPRNPLSPTQPLAEAIAAIQPWCRRMIASLHGSLVPLWSEYPLRLLDQARWPIVPHPMLSMDDLHGTPGGRLRRAEAIPSTPSERG